MKALHTKEENIMIHLLGAHLGTQETFNMNVLVFVVSNLLFKAEQLKCTNKRDRLKEIAATPTITITFVCTPAYIPPLISVVTLNMI